MIVPADVAALALARAETIQKKRQAEASGDAAFAEDNMPLGPRLRYVAASDVVVTPPQWRWRGWLASGVVHLLVGRQGAGKSTWSAHLVARATTGGPYPTATDVGSPMRCGVLSLEEPEDRIVARLIAAGADLDMVDVLTDVEDHDDDGRAYRRPWRLPADCHTLRDVITSRALGMVVVDGLGYAVTGDQSYTTIGSALSGLAGVAEETRTVVLGLTHPPKGASDPVTSAIGSTAWTAVARLVHVLGVDPDDEERRVVRIGKTNYLDPGIGVSFAIANHDATEAGYVTDIQTSTVAAEDLTAAPEGRAEKTERGEAREAVRSLLAEGPVLAAELLKATRDAGVSDTTVKRARSDLGVRAVRRKDPNTGRVLGWELSLPAAETTGSPPEGQPPSDPLDPLDATRAFVTEPVQRVTSGLLDPLDSSALVPSPDLSLCEGCQRPTSRMTDEAVPWCLVCQADGIGVAR